jgi:hypothetical protein
MADDIAIFGGDFARLVQNRITEAAAVSTSAVTVGQMATTAPTTRTLYIAAQPIGVTATGLKPNTRLSIFFDKVNVTAYCAPADYDSTIITPKSTDYQNKGSIGSSIISDSTGTAKFVFYVPQNTFQIGTRELHVFNYTSPSDDFDTLSANHTCDASAFFQAFNHSNVDSDNNAIIGTVPAGSTSTVTLTNRGSGTPTGADPNAPRFDPMCQTFYVGSDATKGYDGVFLNAVDLYFSSKSASQSFTVDIRTVENNIPTTTILPYSVVTKAAADITADTTGQTATRFVFDTPIYLRSGYTYAIGLSPGGQVPDYSIWTGVIGHTDLVNGSVNTNWGSGVLYTSSTGSDWVPVQNQFIKFTLLSKTLASQGTATFVNGDYEFLTYSNNSTTPFQPGEYVYQMPSPLAGFVTVNTTSNTLSFNASASGTMSTNLAIQFAVNDHILVLGSVPPANTTNRIQNWGLFSNAFTAKVTSIDPGNNSLTFAFANGATAVSPFANAACAFYKPAKGTLSITSGSATVTGTGTRFSEQFSNNILDDTVKIPLVAYWSNGSIDNHEVLWPSVIANNTSMTTRNVPLSTNAAAIPFAAPVARVVAVDSNRNLIILDKSTANNLSSNTAYQNGFSTVSYFAPSRVIVGSDSGATALIRSVVDVSLNSAQPVIYDTAVQGTNINYSANLLTSAYSSVNYPTISVSQTNYFANNELVVASKTNEINRAAGQKSIQMVANLTSSSTLLTPTIDTNHTGLIAKSNIIGPSATNEYNGDGGALAKSVSKIVTLGDGMDAEDFNVYLTAFKPSGTQIQVYAKVMNASDSDVFGNKKWTLLQQVTDENLYSDTTNLNDYKEFQYTIPTNPTSINTNDLVTTNNNTTITTTSSANWQSVFTANQRIVLYKDVSLSTFEVHTIASVNSNTSITLARAVSFANTSSAVIGSLTYPEAAYKNSMNNNIVRYHDSTGATYDSYKKFAIKIVMLSSNTASVPKIADMRALALSV